MKISQGQSCFNCGRREPVLRALYDWRRTARDGGWVWFGERRVLCTACFADPRFRGKWIDERQKQTPDKPDWAKEEPEEFAPRASKRETAPAPQPAKRKKSPGSRTKVRSVQKPATRKRKRK